MFAFTPPAVVEVAQADDASSLRAARRAYSQAEAHYRRGRAQNDEAELREALRLFRMLNARREHPNLWFNIAQCHRLLGEAAEAIAAYDAFIAATASPKDRADAEAYRAELQASLSPEPPMQPVPEPDATPQADAVRPPIAASAPPPAAPLATAAAPSLAVAAAPTPAVKHGDPIAVPAMAEPPPEPRPQFYARPWFWIASAVVVAGSSVALYFALHDDKRSTCLIKPIDGPCP